MGDSEPQHTINPALLSKEQEYYTNRGAHHLVDPAQMANQPLYSQLLVGPLGYSGGSVSSVDAPQASKTAKLQKESFGSDDEVNHTANMDIDKTLMPPPAAPASMLYYMRSSVTATPGEQRHRDPFICSRLVAVTVTLFRQGKGKEAKALAQFTVDSIEEEMWHKYLQIYMNAETETVDTVFAFELLEEAREELAKVDGTKAGFLAVLKGLIY